MPSSDWAPRLNLQFSPDTMSTTMPNEEHRSSSKHPRYALRKQEYYQLSDILHKLDKLYKIPEFDNDALEKISIVRGSPFNIDDDDPIDLDPRFFLPGPVENMEYGIDVLDKAPGLYQRRWPRLEPIDNHYFRKRVEEYAQPDMRPSHRANCLIHHVFSSSMMDARRLAEFCQQAASENSSWWPHFRTDRRAAPYSARIWYSPEDGQPHPDLWQSGDCYKWRHGARMMDRYNPHVPHAVFTIYDSSRPLRQGMLRSELRVAVDLLRLQIRRPRVYLNHSICPVLVISFHGRFSARITQAYFQSGKVVVRPSRLIDLHTPVMTSEVRLVIRWLNSRAVGETRLPIPETEQFDDLVPIEVEVADEKGISPETIHVQ